MNGKIPWKKLKGQKRHDIANTLLTRRVGLIIEHDFGITECQMTIDQIVLARQVGHRSSYCFVGTVESPEETFTGAVPWGLIAYLWPLEERDISDYVG